MAKKKLDKVSKYFKFLKALHEKDGQKFSMSELCREHKVNTSTGKVLLDNSIIERVKVGGRKGYKYHWSTDVLPNVKMAEKLTDEMLAIQVANNKKYSGKPTGEIKSKGDKLIEDYKKKMADKKHNSDITLETNESVLERLEKEAIRLQDKLASFEGLEESMLEGYREELLRIQNQHDKELDSLSVRLGEVGKRLENAGDLLEAGTRTLDKAYNRIAELEEENEELRENQQEGVISSDCREASVEFSLLWGVLKYVKFNNQ